jgi:Ca2+-binding RTX toxin-like protein
MVAAGVLLAAPASALAGSVSWQSGVIYFTAGTGEKNVVTVSDGALNAVVFNDTGTPLATDASCTALDANTVQCPDSSEIVVYLGNKDDTATVTLSEPGTSTTLHGDAGNDKLTGGAGPDALDGGPGADVMHGGGGTDNILYTNDSGPVSITLDGVANDGLAGEGDNVAGDLENLYGSPFADTIIANGGDNTFYGYGGADTMDGGGGNDTFFIDGADVIDGGTGIDWVEYFGSQSWNVSLDGNANDGIASDHANVRSGIETVEGGSGNDTLIGDSKANTLLGMGGNDKLVGKSGADTLNGGADTDVCKGGAGTNVYIACETTS